MPAVLKFVLLSVVVVAAVYDLRFRRIPNWVSLSGLVLGLGCNTLFSGLAGLRLAGLGFLCAFGVYLLLYMIRAMGAGDVKLMAAVGSIVGLGNWFQVFLATALVGGVLALITIISKQRFRQTLGNVGLITSELLQFRAPVHADSRLDYRHRDAIRLPHGVAIASGSIVFLLLHVSR